MSLLGKATFCTNGHAKHCQLCHVILSDLLNFYHYFFLFTFPFIQVWSSWRWILAQVFSLVVGAQLVLGWLRKFHSVEKCFTIFVMVDATSSVICQSNVVRIGSSSQCFGGVSLIAALTSSSVTVLKVLNCLPVSKFCWMYFESVWSRWISIRFTMILSIFSVKKSMKPFAKSWTLVIWGVVSCYFWQEVCLQCWVQL